MSCPNFWGKSSLAERRKLIGKGLAGSVLRNLIYELYENNQTKRKKLIAQSERSKEGKSKRIRIKDKDRKILRETDPFEILLSNIINVFSSSLRIKDFNDLYHTSLRIESFKGEFKIEQGKFVKYPNYNYRDLMVEGSGFLQWLSVFTLGLNPGIDILLLDEPDAHLHPSLQMRLIEELGKLSNKQIIIATHSSEIIKATLPSLILQINKKVSYLSEESQKVGLLAGIGSDYSPLLHKLKKTNRILFVEGEIDFVLLNKVGELIGKPLNSDIVKWISANGHKERKNLYKELKKEIPSLLSISIRDRDDESINTVNDQLIDKGYTNDESDIVFMKWKRRNIENYLIIPELIGKISGRPTEDINKFIADKYNIVTNGNYYNHDVSDALCQIDGKNILEENEKSIKNEFKVDRFQIIDNLEEKYLCKDLITMVYKLNDFFK